MNRFLAASNDLAAFEKNAPKNGYQVLSADGFSASTGLIGAGGTTPVSAVRKKRCSGRLTRPKKATSLPFTKWAKPQPPSRSCSF